MRLRKRKISAIIPVRMDSERLSNKALTPLYDGWWSSLDIIINRIEKSSKVSKIILAIAEGKENKPLVNFCEWWNIPYYIGDKEDVLDRVYKTALFYNIETIVDITADCPLVSWEIIDFLLKVFHKKKLEYSSNVISRSWPDGLDVQVYSLEILKSVNTIVPKDSKHRLHTGWNILHYLDCIGRPKIGNYLAPKEWCIPEMGLTLDTLEDKKVLETIFNHFGKIDFSLSELMDYVLNNPQIFSNKNVKRKIPGEG